MISGALPPDFAKCGGKCEWFYMRWQICGKGRGVVQYAALSGIDALSGAIKRKPSGPGLWQAKIHKKPHGPGSEVIR